MAAFAASSTTHACSVCIAHALGAALHGFGAQTLHPGHGVIGLSHLIFSKSNETDEGEGPAKEFEIFNQTSIEAAYGITGSLMGTASVPFVHKSIRVSDEPSESVSGLGDVALGLTYQLPVVEKNPVVTAIGFEVKLPTGANNRSDEEGNRLDEHLQPGTGSTDFALGVLFTMEDEHQRGNLWYGGLRYRWNEENSHGYKYGNVLFYNLGYSFQTGKTGSMAVELVGRLAGKDSDTGIDDENTGGHLIYGSLSTSQTIGRNLGLTASFLVPVMSHLNGVQVERPVFQIALSSRF